MCAHDLIFKKKITPPTSAIIYNLYLRVRFSYELLLPLSPVGNVVITTHINVTTMSELCRDCRNECKIKQTPHYLENLVIFDNDHRFFCRFGPRLVASCDDMKCIIKRAFSQSRLQHLLVLINKIPHNEI